MSSASTTSKSSRLRQPVVAHRPQRVRAFSWLFLLPAVFCSVLFNTGFLYCMSQLSSPGKAAATEGAKNGQSEGIELSNPTEKAPPPPPSPEEKPADPFFIPDTDVDTTVQDVKPDLDSSPSPDINVPDLKNPAQAVPEMNRTMQNPATFQLTPLEAPGGGGGGSSLEGPLTGPGTGIGPADGIPGMGSGLGGIPIPGGLGARSGPLKAEALREGGGTPESELAVERGLIFIAKLQEKDGRFRLDAPSFTLAGKDKSRNVIIPDRGQANDVAGTALALLPFLANGKHHKNGGKDNPFDKPIEKALAYLLRRQDKKTGNFGGGTMYAHGLATIAVCEAYGLTKDPQLKQAAQAGINYIVFSQHAKGGWRYAAGQEGDTSVVGWQIMALKSGQLAYLDVPEATITKAVSFLESTCNPADEGYGYMGRGSTPTMSAVGLLCRQYIQFWGPNNPRMAKGIEKNIKTHPPAGDKNIYYYYYATQVMHHFGGPSWKNWNDKMRDQLVASQVKEGDLAGSWDSRGDHHGNAGGRLMQTSLSLLTLEVYYRHLPLFQQQ